MHIASFAGFSPVNNPAIAVAVVMDNPKGDYYGATVSAPVFAEVAQQVLEYIGVQHDIELRPVRASSKDAPVTEDDAHAQAGDINALYDAANDLPSDDPLRGGPAQAQPAAPPSPTSTPGANPAAGQQNSAAAHSSGGKTTTTVMIDAPRLRVPSLIGLPVRKVIEQAGAAGLEVQITGNGTVREQAPAAGTMVAPGTQIVVRCGR
jgi:cell division protein FtsI (penicillin-binding protein 3)